MSNTQPIVVLPLGQLMAEILIELVKETSEAKDHVADQVIQRRLR